MPQYNAHNNTFKTSIFSQSHVCKTNWKIFFAFFAFLYMSENENKNSTVINEGGRRSWISWKKCSFEFVSQSGISQHFSQVLTDKDRGMWRVSVRNFQRLPSTTLFVKTRESTHRANLSKGGTLNFSFHHLISYPCHVCCFKFINYRFVIFVVIYNTIIRWKKE